MTKIEPIEPIGAVRERVLGTLRQEIISGRLRPGDRLVERELADRFDVSRVPVREAIRALVAEGFVLFETPRRTVVRRLSPTDVKELFELREALEVYAAGLAATRATPEDLAELRELLASATSATEAGDAEAITAVNTRFHDRLLAMAGNTLLISVMEPVGGRLQWLTRRNEEWPQLLTEHQDLYDAIASGDPERARAHALSHVQANYRSTVRHLFEPPSEASPESLSEAPATQASAPASAQPSA
ncbi:DNA-binding transcriptional regulator, GntR family [Streptomyces sp. yr375]|uniref:GntR family transcriptional regulator n=1 Tax=Streptomyces sp. yr375 TaxID=1761906 RepID=UPI0008B6BEEC|nr:GntR family transcriptional regulator [Streptomyces sp. yr375]SEQ53836.1 DNA-binding transcriptional regulator, GntR family [Streptomyces sp. yr375]